MSLRGLVTRPIGRALSYTYRLLRPDISKRDPDLKIDHSLLETCKPHHREAVRLAMNDLYGRRMESLIRLPASVEIFIAERLLTDKRDLVLLLSFIQVTLWLAFSSIIQLFVLPNDSSWSYLWIIPHMSVTWLLLAQRFILALHYATHRPIFKKQLGLTATLLNAFPGFVVGNFFGMPAGTYYLHHIVMHHAANNVFPYDLSSTMPYDRSSPLHLIAYIMNFLLHTHVYLPFYAIAKRRYILGASVVATSATYVYAYSAIYAAAPLFFVISLGSSFALGPCALMLGNYSQHIFIDPDSPKSNYTLACNHLSAPFNMITFNDGYHITHHLSSVTHWSEMPLEFIKNLDRYEAGGALCFRELAFDELTFAVFAGDRGLRRLARHVVQITPEHKTQDELVALMRKRLQPIRSEKDQLKAPHVCCFLANEALWVGAWLCGWPGAAVPCLTIPAFHLISALG